MKLLGASRDSERGSPDFDGRATFHASSSYDLIVSARALYNPDTYKRARQWAAPARKAMGSSLYADGRLFFEGGETALAYGLLRLITSLGAESGPVDFIQRLRSTSAEDCAMLMLDTGETSQEALDFYQSALQDRRGQQQGLEAKVREFAGDFADRSLEVLRDPDGLKEKLVHFLDRYLDNVFASKVDAVRQTVERAATSGKDLLAMQPSLLSVEALTGGYTLSAALRLKEIILAPSVFIYPFMASRVDERAGQALIVYGVRNDDILGYHESNSQDVLESLKSLANPHRLQILTLLRKEPLLGTEFVKLLELSQPTVHHHLAQLRSSGLIRQERTPDGMLYSFRPDTAGSIVARLAHFLGAD